MPAMDRRGFLRTAATAAAGAVLGGCDTDLLNAFNSGTEQRWGMNVHPFAGQLAEMQMEAMRLLGVQRIRMTLGLHTDDAGVYLRGYPSAEYVGLVGDYSDPIPNRNDWPALVRQAVVRSPGCYCYEILNEPMQLTPAAYVQNYLRPAYEVIKSINSGYRVAAAAPTGTSNGRLYFYQMTEAGADSYCDLRAAHLYSDNPEIYLAGTERPFLVTETGVQDAARHVDWYQDTMTHISGVLETERLYFYVLADAPDSAWALISSLSTPGNIGVLSPLYAYIKNKYGP